MKRVLVLGLGVSGRAVARLLLRTGRSVLGIDASPSAAALSLQTEGCSVQGEGEAIDWNAIEEVVVSPGISPKNPLYAQALARGLRICGEAEVALPLLKQRLVAITGTNGKTTVTLLVEHVLNSVGITAKAIGNVGVALADYLLSPRGEEVGVVELSSYQLETMHTPVFEVGVILNITPDHLDRYPSLYEYARAKSRLEKLVPPQALFVHEKAVESYPDLFSDPCRFGWDPTSPLWTDGTTLFFREVASLLPISYKDRGGHDVENALAAWGICRHFHVSGDAFARALETFRKPPHRLEKVEEIRGVSYYDDSKGTNIDAVIRAVESMRSSVILIVGGVDKGASYLPWKEPFKDKVKQLIAIGKAAAKIHEELHPYFAIEHACSLQEAVERAAQLAIAGDCVLLSPGCSSYDQFRDYAHRGEEFQNYVRRLKP